jgi:two-component system OmpR family sensor kinase
VSLRARLLIGVVALVTVGLVAADAGTVVLLRSYLLQRVDRQLQGARGPLSRRAGAPAERDRERLGAPGARPPRGLGPTALYLEVQDAEGKVTDRINDSLVGRRTVAPALPAVTAANAARLERGPFTVGSVGGAGERWRALAVARADGRGVVVVAVPLNDLESTVRRLLVLEGAVTLGVLALIAALAWWMVRLGLRPLDQMEETADAIAAGDLSRRVESSDRRTEVGRLGSALNAMLTQIEAAFTEREGTEHRLRRFVADASHELRTPLTAIRGYAELYQQGIATSPAEVDRAMARIRGETDRMALLVEDLLLLARLDQGRPLRTEAVDLGSVVRDAVDDARAAEPGRPLHLQLPGGDGTPDEAGAAPVVVEGDAARLHQVVANLLANVRTHTPAGAPATVTLTGGDGQARLVIGDRGPGLPEGAGAQVFERFWRADGARSRHRGGFGLGLSIVAGIVQAHGGSVGVESPPGGGAIFTVTLPLGVDCERSSPDHDPTGAAAAEQPAPSR